MQQSRASRRIRTWGLVALGVIVFVLISWGVFLRLNDDNEGAGGEKKRILTTFTVLADMASRVAGDAAEVASLTKAGTEIHGYEPTPQDLVRAQEADLILDNGMNLEKWAEKLYSNAPDVPHVTLTQSITPIPISEGPYQSKPNPHAWMSPANALKYVDAITMALVDVDGANADVYRQNAAKYKHEIKQVDVQLRNQLQRLPAKSRYLVSCEGAFSYLVRNYDLSELYLWPINADAQGTPQQIAHLVEMVRDKEVPAVFCESTVSDKAQRQVAKETGASFGGVFYVDSLSGADGPVPTYLDLLRYNAEILTKGLKSE